MENLTDIYDSLNEHSEETAERFLESQKINPPNNAEVKSGSAVKSRTSPFTAVRQLVILTGRYSRILSRDPPRLLLLMAMPIVLTLLVCIAYQADGNLYKLLKITIVRKSFPFYVGSDTETLISGFACAVFWVGIFNSIQEISKERPIYERERFTGMGVLPYLMSKVLVLTLLCSVQSAIMSALLMKMSSPLQKTISLEGQSVICRQIL